MNHQIKLKFDAEMANAKNTIQSFDWSQKAIYANWLAQCYFFVRHSTRLLATASAHASFNEAGLHLRMAKHISEEVAHEKLAERDLQELGFKVENFHELISTKLFYRNQYFGVERLGASYLLGYILFLEGLAVHSGPLIYNIAKDTFGDRAVSFIRLHVEEDPDHIDKAFQQIQTLSTADSSMVLESLSCSSAIYEMLMKEVHSHAKSPSNIRYHQSQALIDQQLT